ncbi:non-hemolytic phospholipase C [Bordetella ansorpii]|uniref:phospholipase C n=1 Tax=Bordetella ansorpii TaxID=288768 RepID=A0A157RG05_9BORD|nr:phospholipase C, phosphocholine-specific [Bordetella ansorpii]SAI56903.1 non-hemolytic phospholipase C [Bordetella ansorpii]
MSINSSKRKFLRTTLGGAASATALSMFPPAIRRALAIEANNVTGTIDDVEHVVLLMLENRSFDSYFGTFKGARGYGDRFAVPMPNGRNAFYQTDEDGNTLIPYHLDETKGNAQRAGSTPHTWPDAQAAWDHGRMNAWPVAKRPLSMGYYEANEVEFQHALSDAFTLCDAYHCSMHTGTIPNRLYYWSGTCGPGGVNPADGSDVTVAALVNEFNGGNDVGPSTEGWTWTTYADRLQEAGVSWKVYQSLSDNFGCNEMMSFRHWRAEIEGMPVERRPVYAPVNLATPLPPFYDAATDDPLSPLAKGFGNTMPDGFLQSLRDDVAAGKLPSVSWIIPPSVYSEHPGPSSPAQGGWYVQQVLDVLTANPEVWSKTVLLINYDENDGFFDHLAPPSAPSRDESGVLHGASTLSDADMAFEYFNYTPATDNQPDQDGKPFGPGPRVPLWVVSPWSRGGWINSQVFDHTSTLLFLEKRFGVKEPQISQYRRAVCGDLTSAFNFENPNGESLPTLAGRADKTTVDNLALSQTASAAIPVPAATTDSALPPQDTGTRPARALPYELHTTLRAGRDQVTLVFANDSRGEAGAVFHVYDKLHLDRIPRRYAVESGKQLSGAWNLADDAGKYHLWVLGPNGYHREFIGDVNEQIAAGSPEIQVCYALCEPPEVQVKMHNPGDKRVTFTATANAYRTDGPWVAAVEPGEILDLRWQVGDTGQWYDFSVTCDAAPSMQRRFAGHLENGQHSVTDPAMGLAASE